MCVILIILVAIITNTTGKWLIKCLHSARDSNQRLIDYPAIGFEACGKCGRLTVQIFHKATLLGVTSSLCFQKYLFLVVSTMKYLYTRHCSYIYSLVFIGLLFFFFYYIFIWKTQYFLYYQQNFY